MAAGYRSFEAFWLGGASATSVVPPTSPVASVGGLAIPLRKKRMDDDEDVIIIVSQHIAKTRWTKD